MLFYFAFALILGTYPILQVFVEANGRDDVIIPYLDDDTLGINVNDLDEDDEDMLPPCDLTNPDPKLMEWRLLTNSHDIFLDFDNVSTLFILHDKTLIFKWMCKTKITVLYIFITLCR